MKRNIAKSETHVITKKEWRDVFKDTITVKRQKELFKKINERLNFIAGIVGDSFDFYVSSRNEIECCDGSDMIDIQDTIMSIDDGMDIFGYENVPVFWLWDDSWIKEIEKYKAAEKTKTKESEFDKVTNVVSAIRNSLSPEQMSWFRLYSGTIVNRI